MGVYEGYVKILVQRNKFSLIGILKYVGLLKKETGGNRKGSSTRFFCL